MPADRPPPSRALFPAGSSLLLAALSLPLALLLILPLTGLTARLTLPGIQSALASREVHQALALSLLTGLIALTASIALGLPIAYLLARRTFPGRALLDALLDLPLVLPPAVAGLALLLTLGRAGPLGLALGALGINLSFTTAAVVIAQIFVAAPVFIKAARAGLESIEQDLLEAATLDGASPLQRLRFITLPLARPALLAGAALCLARALGEFGATIIFAGNYPGTTQTMPLAIYISLESNLDQAVVLSVILLALAAALLNCVRMASPRA